ncbi:MAG: hypothetical protein AAGF85_07265 [Bacteroidota bacterium]
MRSLYAIVILCLTGHGLFATHLRAGYISYRQIQGNKFEITITGYTNTTSEVLFGEGVLDFGDGSDPFVLPNIAANLHVFFLENGSILTESINEFNRLGVGISRLSVIHDFQTDGPIQLSYTEPNRNENIVNIESSVNVTFSLKTTFSLNSSDTNLSAPSLLFDPILDASFGIDLLQSLSVSDSNDYKLRYELVTPMANVSQRVPGYYVPAGVELNPLNGLLTWPAADQRNLGEYTFAVEVIQFKQISENSFSQIGSMIIDFQVLLGDSEGGIIVSEDSKFNDNRALQILSGTSETINFTIQANDEQVDFNIVSELAGFGAEIFDYEISMTDGTYDLAIFIKSGEDIVRKNPYVVGVNVRVPKNGIEQQYVFLVYTISTEDNLVLSLSNQSFRQLPYPNPTTGLLRSSDFIGQFIQVMALDGSLKSEFYSRSDQLVLNDLEPGSYILRIVGRNPFMFFKR